MSLHTYHLQRGRSDHHGLEEARFLWGTCNDHLESLTLRKGRLDHSKYAFRQIEPRDATAWLTIPWSSFRSSLYILRNVEALEGRFHVTSWLSSEPFDFRLNGGQRNPGE